MSRDIDGFTLFRNEKGNRVCPYVCALMVAKTSIGLSLTACEYLEFPKFVNIFFDDKRRRVMISKAEAGYPNIFVLTLQGSKSGSRRCQINSNEFRRRLQELAGFDFTGRKFLIRGYKAETSQPSVIFELAELKREVLA